MIQTTNPKFVTMEEEIFAPVLTVYVYEDDQADETIRTLDETSPYALTGAIFARNRYVVNRLTEALANTAGNFYINDKCTGAMVGPPALRRRPGLGHQRQGRQLPEPDPLDLAPHHQGVFRSAPGIHLSFHGRGMTIGPALGGRQESL